MPGLSAEEYEELKRLTSSPGVKLTDDERTRALGAVQGFEDQGIQEWGAAGAPGQPGVAEKLDPQHDILPQALALQPGTTHPGGDQAAEQEWMAGGGGKAGSVYVYEPPLNLVKKKLLEDPQFARTLFPNLPPDPAAITKMTQGDSTYQAAADMLWRQTADAAAQSGKTAYRYSKTPWLQNGGAMSGLQQFGVKALGAVKPASEGIDSFIMGVDDTAAFGALRGAQEGVNPELKEPNEMLGIESVGGVPSGKARDRNAAIQAEHPALYGLGQGIGLLAPWGASNQAYQLAARGGEGLAKAAGGAAATRLAAAGGAAAVGGAASQAGHELVDAASNYARTGTAGTTLGEAGERVRDVGLDPINLGLGVAGEGIGQLASRGAEMVREGPRYNGAPGRFERLGGEIKMGRGPVPVAGTEGAIKEAHALDVHPADVMAKEIAPQVAAAESKAVAAVKKQVGEENKVFYPTDEGQMLLPAATLQQEVLGELQKHVTPGEKGLRPLPKSQGTIKEMRKLFNGNIADGGVSIKPTPGAIELTPDQAEAFLNPEFQRKLRPKGDKPPAAPAGGREPSAPAGGASKTPIDSLGPREEGLKIDDLRPGKPERAARPTVPKEVGPEGKEGAAGARSLEPLREAGPAMRRESQRLGKMADTVNDPLAVFPNKERVSLADVRDKLGDMPREKQDEVLRQMQRDGELVLYRNDNPRSLTARDKAAEMTVGDSPRHLVYFTRGGVPGEAKAATANLPEWKEGAGKTYISDLYEQAKGKFKSREEFNEALLKAHRGTKGGALHSLDLVAAADPKKLAASKVKGGNAEYDLVDTKEAGRLLKEWGLLGAGATLAASQDDEQGEGAAAAGVIGLAKSLKRRGISKVYVTPRRYNAEQHETLIKTLQNLSEDPQNPAARVAKKLYEAAFIDRDARPMKGQQGGWSAYQNEHSKRIEGVKRNAELAAPGGDSFQPLVDYSKQRMGQLPLVDAVRSAADRAGVREQVDRIRGLDPLMSLRDQMAVRGPGRGVQPTAVGAANSLFDQANMRFGYPTMKALERSPGQIRGGTAGRATQVGRDEKDERK